jgi:hypothetical protein
MRRVNRALLAGAAVGSILLGLAGAQAAGATGPARPDWHNYTCKGNAISPGVLAGDYLNVVVKGVCYVNSGIANVSKNLTVTPRSTLVAAFGMNDRTKRGGSALYVSGNLYVRPGSTLILGCEDRYDNIFGKKSPTFPCFDDPHPKKPTLSSHGYVGGNLIALRSLGVVVHNSTIGGSVIERSGGGGLNCRPTGEFAEFKSPVYSDYEDDWVGRTLEILGLRSCWYGALRDYVGRDGVVEKNIMADPDAGEVNTNVIKRDLICRLNKPAIQFGDSDGKPNRVARSAQGQCAFNVILPSPAPEAHLHVKVKYLPISVRLR